MSAIASAPAAAQHTTVHFQDSGPAVSLKRWWAAYRGRRDRRTAMVALCAMSDRELWDIGLTRCDIPRAASGEIARDLTSRRNA